MPFSTSGPHARIGFRPQIEKIMRRLPAKRQTLMMSATLPPTVLRLSQRYMIDPEQIRTSPEVLTVDKIDQKYITVDEEKKFDLLVKVLERTSRASASSSSSASGARIRLYKMLKPTVPKAGVTHGDLPQPQREKIWPRSGPRKSPA